ncbi:FAD-binding oxidoreductase [Jatrophihabitans sp.]|uniref:NAD(P)/FAD-dependent oxidoreductase n=1 Tax=Jatrophihabitans sp. TaxID=1932789 RepID=UPI0030C75F55|nr:putative oxidoreductase [Jatrophihabitans sp.]
MAVAWDADPVVAAWPGLPVLDGDRTADVCVVGLGGSGLAAVRAALDRGLSVIGVDAGRIAAGAAGRNGGFLIAGPAESMTESTQLWGGDAALWLYRETLAELESLTELGIVRRNGSIRLAGLPGEPLDDAEASDRAAELLACAEEAELLRSLGLAVESYDGPLGRGLFLPRDGAVNPARRAVEQARRAVEQARRLDGSALHEHTRVSDIRPGRVTTAHGVISAGAVVVAVDGRLEVLLPQLAGAVRTTRLQMLATAPVAERLPCPVYGRWGYDYAQQDAQGQLYVGGGRDHHLDTEWTTSGDPTAAVQGYIETVAARMAGGPVEVTHRWAASVGYTGDGRAICAAVEEGVVACGGYSGTGNLVGPVAARAALALVLDGTAPTACFRSDLGH